MSEIISREVSYWNGPRCSECGAKYIDSLQMGPGDDFRRVVTASDGEGSARG